MPVSVTRSAINIGARKTRNLAPQPQTSFREIKHETKPTLLQVVTDYAVQWERAAQSAQNALRGLPAHSRGLLELQLLTNRLHAETELVTRMGEAAASTLKRLQQSGSN